MPVNMQSAVHRVRVVIACVTLMNIIYTYDVNMDVVHSTAKRYWDPDAFNQYADAHQPDEQVVAGNIKRDQVARELTERHAAMEAVLADF